MSELVSVQSDSGRADPQTVITWPMMARCRGCSTVVPLAYRLHVYAEEP